MSARLSRRLLVAARSAQTGPVSVEGLLRAHGTAAPGSLLLLMAVPCMLPIPGTGTVLGLGLLALAAALWRGETLAWLPQRVARFEMSASCARRVLETLARVHAVAGRFTRARLPWVMGGSARRGLAALVAAMAVVLILPIPFGNVLPAVALVLIGLGLAARDGLAALLGAGLATLTGAGTVLLLVMAASWGGEWALGWLGG